MFTLVITEKGGAQRKLEFDKAEITIGRVTGNDIVLPKGNVSKRHSRIVLKDGRYIVVDLKSTNGTYVNGRKITSPLVIKPGDKVYIGDFIISLDGEGAESNDAPPPRASAVPDEPQRAAAPPLPAAPRSTQGAAGVPAVAPRPPGPPPVRPSQELSPPVQPRQSMPQQPTPAPAPLAPRLSSIPPALPPVSSEASVESIDDEDEFDPTPAPAPAPAPARPAAATAQLNTASAAVLPRTQESAQQPARIATSASQVKPMAQAVAKPAMAPIATSPGTDPIDSLVSDARVQEIIIESPNRIVVDVGMGLEDAPFNYASLSALNNAINRVFSAAGATVESGAAVYEANGESWNVHLVRVPSASGSPMLVMRRVGREFVAFDALVSRGSISTADVDGLKAAVAERRNILVSGPSTRSVSPVLAALAGLAAERERVVVIETAPSMGVPRAMHLYLSSKTSANFLNALQKARLLRADRIVIEEIEGAEAFDALVAMSGRRGSLASVFASSGAEALSHLQLLVSLDGRVTAENAQLLVQKSVNLVVHVDLDESGNPVITEIASVG